MQRGSSVYVAGHKGLVGSALVRRLAAEDGLRLILRSRDELDLTNQQATAAFFASERPDYVFVAAAKVGGIQANRTLPADFIRENLLIQTNLIHSAWANGAKKLLFLGSSCIYPRDCPQPIREEYLLTGPLEPSNRDYAVAKIAGLSMCQAYRRQYGFDAICAMPTNLYGPGDNFHPEHSHVVPGLIRRFDEAKKRAAPTVTIWGSGLPLREFLHADDLADALVFLMRRYSEEAIINVGSGQEISIAELAREVAETTGYRGDLIFDSSKPDGTPRKLLDSSRIHALGWRPSIDLRTGLANTYAWFSNQAATHS